MSAEEKRSGTAFWGDSTYKDGVPVPLTEYRCKSSDTSAHVCKLHEAHDGRHLCICDKRWN